MEPIKQFLFRDMILIDTRVLLLVVPAAMMLMRAIINQNIESVVELSAIGVLSYLWIESRQRHFFKHTYTESSNDNHE